MTISLQSIDGHIGIIYKKAVYKAYWKEMKMRSRKHLKNQRGNNVTPTALPAMSAGDKRILITRSISETHKAMCGSGALKLRRAFIAVFHLLCARFSIFSGVSTLLHSF
jgi:hypothetical protein